MKLSVVSVLVFGLSLSFTASAHSQATTTSTAKAMASGQVDRAYLQSIWDGWAAGNIDGQSKYYAKGPGHLYFDISPVKYESWDEYKSGVVGVLAQFSAARFTLNDDLQIHPQAGMVWVDGTLTGELTSKSGQKQVLPIRWTAIFEQQNGVWVIQHEHVSVPMQ